MAFKFSDLTVPIVNSPLVHFSPKIPLTACLYGAEAIWHRAFKRLIANRCIGGERVASSPSPSACIVFRAAPRRYTA